MSDPMISIIMPVYNAGEFLDNTISYIQRQTYSDFELICIDDGSTDDSLEKIEQYAEKDSRVIRIAAEHHGAGQARNIGIDKAKGKYLIFLDCDDEFDECLLEYTVELAEERSADIVCFDASYIDNETGLEMPSHHVVRRDCILQKDVFSSSDCPETLLAMFFNVVWTKLYRKELIDKYHIRFESCEYMNDVYFHHVALLHAGRICYLDKKLVYYQQNRPGNHSNASNYARKTSIASDVTNRVRDYILQHGMNKRLLLGLLENELFRMKGVLESQDEVHFHEMYRIYKEEITGNPLLNELSKREWADKELTSWGKALAELDETAFLNYEYHQFRDRYWQQFYCLKQIKKDREIVGNELEVLIKHKHWRYDEGILSQGERVVIHGGGEVGRDYAAQIRREGKAILAGWVDRNYMNLDPELGIKSPDEVSTLPFDTIHRGRFAMWYSLGQINKMKWAQ